MQNLKTLKIFNSRINAEVIRSLLESYGIKSWIFSDDAGGMYPAQASTIGVRLMVDENDFKTATNILIDQEI
jgi:hypothetical protein